MTIDRLASMKGQRHPTRFVPHLQPAAALPLLLGAGLLVVGSGLRTHAGHHATGQPPVGVVPPDGQYDGRTYSEWMARWWQWALAIPWDGHHPLQDRTGSDARRGQSGPVWFLGAGPVSGPSITREILVPEGQRLYVAVGNVECSTLEPEPFHGDNEAALRACAEGFHLQDLVCEVDGQPVSELESYQVTSRVFSIDLPARNLLGVAGGGIGQSVASGVGLILDPLPPGLHAIYVHSAYAEDPAGSLSEMTYQITVVARPALSIRPLPGTGRMEVAWHETPGYSLYQADSCDPSVSWTAAPVESSTVDNGVRTVTAAPGPAQRYYRLEFR